MTEDSTELAITIAAPAKFNVWLRVFDRLPNGFHALQSIILPLSLADLVTVRVRRFKGEHHGEHHAALSLVRPGVPLPKHGNAEPPVSCVTTFDARLARHVEACSRQAWSEQGCGESEAIAHSRRAVAQAECELSSDENLAARAARAFLRDTRVGSAIAAIEIEIFKRIPFGAGLGGGSADAAAVLTALNSLLGEPLTRLDLRSIAGGLGSDIPALLSGGAAYLTGDGGAIEEVVPASGGVCDALYGAAGVIIKPPWGSPTAAAYAFLGRPFGVAPETGVDTPLGRTLFERFGITAVSADSDAQFTGNRLTLFSRPDICQGPQRGAFPGLSRHQVRERVRAALEVIHNDFEEPILASSTACGAALRSVVREVCDAGSERVMLAGSGSSVVAFVIPEDAHELSGSSVESSAVEGESHSIHVIVDRLRERIDDGWFVAPVRFINERPHELREPD